MIIQIVMVGLIIAFPGIVTRETNEASEGNLEQLQIDVDRTQRETKPEPALPGTEGKGKDAAEDPMEAIRRANEQDKAKK